MNYIIAPTDNDILHSRSHKYIDRKRGKNGQWVYTYSNKEKPIGKREPKKEAPIKKVLKDYVNNTFDKDNFSGKDVATDVIRTANNNAFWNLIGALGTGYDYAKVYKTNKDIDDRLAVLDDKIKNASTGYYYTWADDGSVADVERLDTLEKERDELLKLKEKNKQKNKQKEMKHNYIIGNGYVIAPTGSDIFHAAPGQVMSGHKYIDRKMGRNGKWIYIYNKPKLGERIKGRISKIKKGVDDIKKYGLVEKHLEIGGKDLVKNRQTGKYEERQSDIGKKHNPQSEIERSIALSNMKKGSKKDGSYYAQHQDELQKLMDKQKEKNARENANRAYYGANDKKPSDSKSLMDSGKDYLYDKGIISKKNTLSIGDTSFELKRKKGNNASISLSTKKKRW